MITWIEDMREDQVKDLVQAVKRNIARFPSDFMFQLTRVSQCFQAF